MKKYTQPLVEVMLLTPKDVFLYLSIDNEVEGEHNKEFGDIFV